MSKKNGDNSEIITSENIVFSGSFNQKQKFGLRAKVTLIALALSTIPVLIIGSVSYQIASNSLEKEIVQAQEERAKQIADKFTFYMRERYGDIQIMGGLAIFTNPKVRDSLNQKDKGLVLDNFIQAYAIYDSVAAFDLQGNLIAQSSGKKLGNHSNRSYFQAALKSDRPIITQPSLSQSQGDFNIYIAAKIKDGMTGKTLGIIRSRLPVKYLEDLLKSEQENKSEHKYIINQQGEIFVANNPVYQEPNKKELIKAQTIFPDYQQLNKEKKKNSKLLSKELLTYIPMTKSEDIFRSSLPDLGWSIIATVEKKVAFAPQQKLLEIIVAGTGITTILIALLAAYIAKRITRRLVLTTGAVEQIGQGNLQTRIPIQGNDEIAQLGFNINSMAEQIQDLLLRQEETTRMQAETEELNRKKEENVVLQQQLTRFLLEIEGASRGDLTVRAQITDDEIGIVADFFNSIIESLREIVIQVKQAANQVNSKVGENEQAIDILAEEALTQAERIEETLNSVAKMSVSIQEVAKNAQTAAEIARIASNNALKGGLTMERTVERILHLKDTVADTAKKVKKLGESSQQISKVVALINQVSLKTKYLAVNAGIEAARAGEEARGFAVVAEEVGELAAQSTASTKAIEQIIETIQKETIAAVKAMEISNKEVIEGTVLIEETKQSLAQIVEVSQQIDNLVQSISQATVSQNDTSSVVRELMSQIAQISQKTSHSSRQVSDSLQETVGIAQQLQASVGTFKVEI